MIPDWLLTLAIAVGVTITAGGALWILGRFAFQQRPPGKR